MLLRESGDRESMSEGGGQVSFDMEEETCGRVFRRGQETRAERAVRRAAGKNLP